MDRDGHPARFPDLKAGDDPAGKGAVRAEPLDELLQVAAAVLQGDHLGLGSQGGDRLSGPGRIIGLGGQQDVVIPVVTAVGNGFGQAEMGGIGAELAEHPVHPQAVFLDGPAETGSEHQVGPVAVSGQQAAQGLAQGTGAEDEKTHGQIRGWGCRFRVTA